MDSTTGDGSLDEPDGLSRRRFLSLLSASAAASAALALGSSCSRIDRGTIVPYTRRPGDILPGVAAYYASTFQEGLTTHGVLVKTIDGRPIHIEGNAEHPNSRGKTSLRSMGDLLGLYDPDRLSAPVHKGAPSNWEEAENSMVRSLSDARRQNRRALLLTGAIVSPSQKAIINDLKRAVPGLCHLAWEPAVSDFEALATLLYEENLVRKLKARVSRLHFERADVVLSLQSDFLGIDANAPVYIQDFAAHRNISRPTDRMNRLWVVEGTMTLTGFNADQRLQARPSLFAGLAFALARHLNESYALPLPAGMSIEDLRYFALERVAQDLGIETSILRLLASDLAKAGKSALVLAGPALPLHAYGACYLLNTMLGAMGNTLVMSAESTLPELTNLSELSVRFEEAARGEFSLGIFWGPNSAYAFPDNLLWKKVVAKIPDTYRIGLYEDETALDCSWRLPEHHWLEAWGDFESAADFISLRQPVIGALHDTRQAEDFLLSCMRKMGIPMPHTYLEYMKSRWKSDVFPKGSPAPFENFWNAALHDGGIKRTPAKSSSPELYVGTIRACVQSAAKEPVSLSSMELILTPAAGVYDGRYANNGWLNELPDPVTKATWGNPLLLSATDAERLGLKDEDVAKISAGGKSVEAPVLVQPGQTPGVAALALGYGRRTGSVAAGIGVNAFPLVDSEGVSIERLQPGKRRAIPKRQAEDRIRGDQVRSWTLAEYSEKIRNGAVQGKTKLVSLIPDQKFSEHKWSMAIDLSACVGCSACVIACQSENNIPVVGPERVRAGREMQWIRIDRYYKGDLRNPSVLFQPVLCQHCDNAPCEIVCPVNATTHSPDGLNQMVYNRCVGTRYCSNNCPFKVRRFNFFDYTSMKKEPENLVFNPEVSVRPRGVMEKCTFCVQRIENARQKAKVEGRPIRDGEIQPACAAACPARAIVFGDINDPQSKVSIQSKTDRNYRMLEELGIKPSVTYLVDISNPAVGKDRA
jgi:Fe-S-cluster-containing dehydrogenase component